jgi:hypothetical protein
MEKNYRHSFSTSVSCFHYDNHVQQLWSAQSNKIILQDLRTTTPYQLKMKEIVDIQVNPSHPHSLLLTSPSYVSVMDTRKLTSCLHYFPSITSATWLKNSIAIAFDSKIKFFSHGLKEEWILDSDMEVYDLLFSKNYLFASTTMGLQVWSINEKGQVSRRHTSSTFMDECKQMLLMEDCLCIFNGESMYLYQEVFPTKKRKKQVIKSSKSLSEAFASYLVIR